MATTLPHEQEAFDKAWSEEAIPADVTLQQAQKTAEILQRREQEQQDFKDGWTEG